MTIDHSPLVSSRPQWFQKMVELFFKDLSEVLTPSLLVRSRQVFLKSLKTALATEAEGLSFLLKRESEATFEQSELEQRTSSEGSFGARSRPTAGARSRPTAGARSRPTTGAQVTAGAEATAGESETEETPEVFLKEESTMTVEGEEETFAVDDLDFEILSTHEDEGEEVEEEVIIKKQDKEPPVIVETEVAVVETVRRSKRQRTSTKRALVDETVTSEEEEEKEEQEEENEEEEEENEEEEEKKEEDDEEEEEGSLAKRKKIPCNLCGKLIGSSRGSQRSHKLRVHGERKDCDVCGKSLPLGYLYQQHIRCHTEGPKKTCEQCGERFATASELYHHVQRFHDPKIPCKTCGKEFSKVNLYRHEKRHRGDILRCSVCFEMSSSQDELAIHKREEHSNLPIFYCTVCDKKLLSEKTVETHMAKQHAFPTALPPPEPATCGKCGKTYANKRQMARHMVRVHTENKVTCTICGYRLSEKLFPGHMNDHARFPENSCAECGTSYKNVYLLRAHMRVKHMPRVPCHVCGKSYVQGTLQRHLLTHSQDKFQCDQCSSTFKSPHSLKDHKRVIHPDKEAEVSCYICGLKFKHPYRLKKHMKRHEPPQFQCDICQKKFFAKGDLNHHVRQCHLTATKQEKQLEHSDDVSLASF
ncbi:unnamed protein product [Cyprideis torosa]|uniref:Uncharacterized protein n=1 Tax=Cyprideis torosa TaxID=163714 RepID=A0A7R8WBA6_9CRUS|nr:unnamed protein product [Cyprideis torosa]CAG0889354.1 unnamed protein product [Cyprideis torosa]